MRRRIASLFATGVIALALLTPSRASVQSKVELLGCSLGPDADSGTLYDVNRSTGQTSNPRPTGIHWLMDVAFDRNGTLYGLTTFASDPPNSLVRIHPSTGQYSTVGATGLDSIYEGDMAFDPRSGDLFGIQYVNPGRGMFRINPATGQATLVGDMGMGDISDVSVLEFDNAGNLYAVDTERDVVCAIDPNTARILSTVSLSTALGITAGMAFHPDEEVFYIADGYTNGTDSLYQLDVHTGRMTLVGSLNLPGGLSGLTFQPRQVR